MDESRTTPGGKAFQTARRGPRKRVLFGGKIVFDDGAFTVDCTIRDLSETGARITLGWRVSIPAEVYFIDLKSGTAYAATVVWRHSPNFGLQFSRKIDLATAPDELPHLTRLWNASSGRQ